VSDVAAAIEATSLAQFLKRSALVYPLVNAGHVAGMGLLFGSVVALDLRLLGLGVGLPLRAMLRFLRGIAVAGLVLAICTGALLFVTQAGDYLDSPVFRVKMALLGVALALVALHWRVEGMSEARQQIAAGLSLILWCAVLIAGRMIAYA
jgi:hypothetical protein